MGRLGSSSYTGESDSCGGGCDGLRQKNCASGMRGEHDCLWCLWINAETERDSTESRSPEFCLTAHHSQILLTEREGQMRRDSYLSRSRGQGRLGLPASLGFDHSVVSGITNADTIRPNLICALIVSQDIVEGSIIEFPSPLLHNFAGP